MRKKHLALAICMALATPLASHATVVPNELVGLSLGEIQSESFLNQPFRGKIPILHTSLDQAQLLKVRLAPDTVFQKAGIDRLPIIDSLGFHVISKQGRPVIEIRSQRPVDVPFLNFVLEIAGPQGVSYQDYTVLLDPPDYVQEQFNNLSTSFIADYSGATSENRFVKTANLTSESVEAIARRLTQGAKKIRHDVNASQANKLGNPLLPRQRQIEQQFLNHPLVKQAIQSLNGKITRQTAGQAANYSARDLIRISNQLSVLLEQQRVAGIPPTVVPQQNRSALPAEFRGGSQLQATIQRMARDAVSSQVAQQQSQNDLLRSVHASPRLLAGKKTQYRVKSGDSLSLIAQRLNTGEVSLEKMIRGLYRANPAAFVAGDINRLKSGAVLQVPTVSALKNDHFKQAARQAVPEAIVPSSSGAAIKTATYKVKKGDSLSSIVRKTGYRGASFTKMLKSIFDANSQAFDGNNINRLKSGAVLILPQHGDVVRVTKKEAGSDVANPVDQNNDTQATNTTTSQAAETEAGSLVKQSQTAKVNKAPERSSASRPAATKPVSEQMNPAQESPQATHSPVVIKATEVMAEGQPGPEKERKYSTGPQDSQLQKTVETTKSDSNATSEPGTISTLSTISQAEKAAEEIVSETDAEYEIKVYAVKKGDTLSQIVQEIGYPDIPMMEMMKAIYTANPDAFEKSNITILKEGAMIRVPSREEITGSRSNGKSLKKSATTTQSVEVKPSSSESVNPKTADSPVATTVGKNSIQSEGGQLPDADQGKSDSGNGTDGSEKSQAPSDKTGETIQPESGGLDPATQNNPLVQQLEKRLRELRRDLVNTKSTIAALETSVKSKNEPVENEQTLTSASAEQHKEAITPVADTSPDAWLESSFQGMLDFAKDLRGSDVDSDSPMLDETESFLRDISSSALTTFTDKTMLYTTLALFLGLLLIRYRKRIYAYKPVSYEYPNYYPERRRKARLSDFDRKLHESGFFDVRRRLLDSNEEQGEISDEFLHQCESLLEDLESMDDQKGKPGQSNLDKVCDNYIEQFKKDLEVAKQNNKQKDTTNDGKIEQKTNQADESVGSAQKESSQKQVVQTKAKAEGSPIASLDQLSETAEVAVLADDNAVEPVIPATSEVYISDGLQIRTDDYKKMGRAVFHDDYSDIDKAEEEGKDAESDAGKAHSADPSNEFDNTAERLEDKRSDETSSDLSQKLITSEEVEQEPESTLIDFDVLEAPQHEDDYQDTGRTIEASSDEDNSTTRKAAVLSFAEFEQLETGVDSTEPGLLTPELEKENKEFANFTNESDFDRSASMLELDQALSQAEADKNGEDEALLPTIDFSGTDFTADDESEPVQTPEEAVTDSNMQETAFFELNLDDALAFDKQLADSMDASEENRIQDELTEKLDDMLPADVSGATGDHEAASDTLLSGQNGYSDDYDSSTESINDKESSGKAGLKARELNWKDFLNEDLAGTTAEETANSAETDEPSRFEKQSLDIVRNETYQERNVKFKPVEKGQLDLLSIGREPGASKNNGGGEMVAGMSRTATKNPENENIAEDLSDCFSCYEEYSLMAQSRSIQAETRDKKVLQEEFH